MDFFIMSSNAQQNRDNKPIRLHVSGALGFTACWRKFFLHSAYSLSPLVCPWHSSRSPLIHFAKALAPFIKGTQMGHYHGLHLLNTEDSKLRLRCKMAAFFCEQDTEQWCREPEIANLRLSNSPALKWGEQVAVVMLGCLTAALVTARHLGTVYQKMARPASASRVRAMADLMADLKPPGHVHMRWLFL
ncbi:unnamed protein product [Pleuronectes platessa]|uniref:Uncharacterized protein n=1 Tax=Pleuronectes platessa TaxID=8262 RepID=A0A9N7VH75_PLEPL|nr:unnamed protein product [Pleuronectes platessa]